MESPRMKLIRIRNSLFEMNDTKKLKYELSRQVKAKDYKTVNKLLRRNHNTW